MGYNEISMIHSTSPLTGVNAENAEIWFRVHIVEPIDSMIYICSEISAQNDNQIKAIDFPNFPNVFGVWNVYHLPVY